jgi:hypothetical protein
MGVGGRHFKIIYAGHGAPAQDPVFPASGTFAFQNQIAETGHFISCAEVNSTQMLIIALSRIAPNNLDKSCLCHKSTQGVFIVKKFMSETAEGVVDHIYIIIYSDFGKEGIDMPFDIALLQLALFRHSKLYDLIDIRRGDANSTTGSYDAIAFLQHVQGVQIGQMFDQMFAEKIVKGLGINRETPGSVYVKHSIVQRGGVCIEPSIQHIWAGAKMELSRFGVLQITP